MSTPAAKLAGPVSAGVFETVAGSPFGWRNVATTFRPTNGWLFCCAIVAVPTANSSVSAEMFAGFAFGVTPTWQSYSSCSPYERERAQRPDIPAPYRHSFICA